MYHSIGLERTQWLWSSISLSVELFEKQLNILNKRNFKTIDLNEYLWYLNKSERHDNFIVLTFDDGYLDNWVYAYPLLKKYNFKATIFINPEFIDPGIMKRPNLEDVWLGKLKYDELIVPGFVNWEELKEMETSGVFDVQSHSMTHTWYFKNDNLIDFHHPNDKYPWLAWNEVPQRKYAYLNETQDNLCDFGKPIYEYDRALGIRRYFPDKKIDELLIAYIKQHGGINFFNNKNWRKILFDIFHNYESTYKINGRYETDEELMDRINYELWDSKNIIEKKLNKKVDFLCFPGGAYTDLVLQKCLDAGYKAVTHSSKSKVQNNFNSYRNWIVRIGCVSDFYWRNRFVCQTDAKYFLLHIKQFKHQKFYLFLIRIKKVQYLIRYIIYQMMKRRCWRAEN